MITNYPRPQTEIAQQLESTENTTLDRIHAVIVGPAYIHADADADNLVFQTYQEGAAIGYALLRAGVSYALGSEIVDQDNVRVVAKDLRLTLFSEKEGFTPDATGLYGGSLFFAGGVLDTEDPSVATAFDNGRAPTPGDIYRISSDGYTTIERKVVGLIGQDIGASVGDSAYLGAEGSGSGATDDVAVSYSSFDAPTATLNTVGIAARLYGRRYGAYGLADNDGLRLVVEVICLTEGAEPTFSATVNGVPTSVVRTLTGTTRFTLLTNLVIDVTRTNLQWVEGDRIIFDVDLEHNPDVTLFDSSADLTGYTYVDSSKRSASSLVIDVISLADNGAPTVRISDTAGLAVPTTEVLSASLNTITITYDTLGSIELSLELEALDFTKFHVGQRYALPVVPPSRSTTLFDRVQLNAPIGAIGDAATVDVTAYVPFSGTLTALEPILGGTNYEVGTDEVTLDSLGAPVAGYANETVCYAADGKGQVALQWRAAIPAGASDGLIAIESSDDIVDNFHSYQLGSELGYGLAKAFGGSQGKRVYALNTGGDSVEDFRTAFDKLEASATIYTIGVLTEDEEIMQMAAEHVQRMSASTVKLFRRAYVGTDSPGEFPVLEFQDDGSAYSATVEIGSGGEYTLVTFAQDDLDLTQLSISAGDKFLITGTGQTYVIAEVNGEKTLSLVTGPNSPVGETSCQIIAADTPENTARFVWDRSERLGANVEQDRRICNIWTHEGRLDNVLIPNRFGACEVAGLRTAVQPQQGLTRTELSYIDSAPAMYTRFKPSLLDDMAERGVWIISQNSAEGSCYIRHQLTTAVSNGSLYFEDSAGVNVDSVCFAIDAICDPLIGKRNATPRTVVEIKNELHEMLSGLTQDSFGSDLGPQLVKFYNSNGDADTLDVSINKVFKDRIDVAVVLEIPLPLNNIRVVVMARTIKDTAGVAVTTLSAAVSLAA